MKHPTIYFLTLLFITMAPSTKNFPIDQLEKKLEIYRLFENLFELTDYSLRNKEYRRVLYSFRSGRKNAKKTFWKIKFN